MIPTLQQRLRVLGERLIPSDSGWDAETLRQAGRIAAVDLAMLVWVVVFAPIYFFVGAVRCSLVLAAVGVILPATLFLLHRGYRPSLCGNLLCCAGWWTYAGLIFLTGGLAGPSPVLTWYASLPICAVYMCGLRSGTLWTVASVAAITAFAMVDNWGWKTPNELTADTNRLLQYLSLVGLVACVYVLVYVLARFEQFVRRTLDEANCRLEAQSSLDSLTGIANRRAFDWTLDREWKRHQRADLPLSVALIDVDWFKQYNDALGHLAGDDVLRSIALALQSGVHRPGDFVARFGGEEFAVILPNTDQQQARYVMATVHQRVRGLEIAYPKPAIGPYVTISIGIATTDPSSGESPLELVREADMALYRAKAEGRDRSIHAARIPVESGMHSV